jgi:hypothetical protein
VIGPALPSIAPSKRPSAPIRWVDAEDLSDWANRTDGAVSLPTLLAHLIRATHGPTIQLRFPADEGVRHPGWDGRTSTETGSTYVPRGDAGWEIGSQRSNIAQKATEDYRKRTAVPEPLDPADAAYVFVTPPAIGPGMRNGPRRGRMKASGERSAPMTPTTWSTGSSKYLPSGSGWQLAWESDPPERGTSTRSGKSGGSPPDGP